jgi:hypothetical protein
MPTTSCSSQLLTLTALKSVSPERLQRATTILAENSLGITLTRQSESEIRALVKNGEGREYGVTIADGLITCSCKDALYRGVTCKHAVALALWTIRQPRPVEVPTVEKENPNSVGEQAKLPNLKLAKVRPSWMLSA